MERDMFSRFAEELMQLGASGVDASRFGLGRQGKSCSTSLSSMSIATRDW